MIVAVAQARNMRFGLGDANDEVGLDQGVRQRGLVERLVATREHFSTGAVFGAERVGFDHVRNIVFVDRDDGAKLWHFSLSRAAAFGSDAV